MTNEKSCIYLRIYKNNVDYAAIAVSFIIENILLIIFDLWLWT